ncbi:MAG: hypothetical protein ACYDA0_06285 [Candidatus Dormibacteraceae bacterium]
MIADGDHISLPEGWQDQDGEGHPLIRRMAITPLGGAILNTMILAGWLGWQR